MIHPSLKRSPLSRGSATLKRSTLARGKGLRPVNDRRYAEQRRAQFTGPWATVTCKHGVLRVVGYDHSEEVKRRGCVANGEHLRGGELHLCYGADPAHVVRRSRGGLWHHQVGLCRELHRFLDIDCANDPARFLEETGLDLAKQADLLAIYARKLNGPTLEAN